jgi:uncharacterized protein YndB with AHSA1/START domain
MAPVTVTLHAPIGAPMQRVFSILSDPARMPEWYPGAQLAAADRPMAKGTILTVRFPRGTTRFEVVDWHPPATFGWIESGGRKGSKTFFLLEFRGGQTAFTMRVVWTPSSLYARVLGVLLRRRNVQRQFNLILNNLRHLAVG